MGTSPIPKEARDMVGTEAGKVYSTEDSNTDYSHGSVSSLVNDLINLKPIVQDLEILQLCIRAPVT